MGNLFATSNWNSVPEEGAPEGEPVVESTPENSTSGVPSNTSNSIVPKAPNQNTHTSDANSPTSSNSSNTKTPHNNDNKTQNGVVSKSSTDTTKEHKNELPMKGGRRKKRKTRRRTRSNK
jgi:hypothetical protein